MCNALYHKNSKGLAQIDTKMGHGAVGTLSSVADDITASEGI
jgi:hypothetical protein